MAKSSNLFFRITTANRRPRVPETDALECPATIRAFCGSERTERAFKFQRCNHIIIRSMQFILHVQQVRLFPMQFVTNQFRNLFHSSCLLRSAATTRLFLSAEREASG